MRENKKKHASEQKGRQRGSALVYILIAIALLAALTVTFMEPSSQQTSSQNTFETVSELNTQIGFIRSSVQECVLTYPAGDTSLPAGTTNTPYPINPSSSYFTPAPKSGAAANDQVRNIMCPGNPGDSNDHADIYSGASGKFLAPPPSLFEEFVYYNGINGVFFFTQTDKTDAFLQSAMQKLDDQFSECEADVIDASGGQVELTSTAGGGDPKCPAGSTCFRVWMITHPSASGAYNGDTDGDEAACP
ncbi:MAG: hypothetical protein H6853_00105 [Rhodospirillales bacterium]|nr:hypothetical protein [Alphaproteobacteria bacterium]USO03729.1 MAG: hypothetical protein H6853_00105 [Rhodospirillales bacterium]